MALVIINRQAAEAGHLTQLKHNLIQAQYLAEQIQRQAANATDQDIQTVYGVPAADATVFKNVVDNVVTTLNDNSINNYIGNLA